MRISPRPLLRSSQNTYFIGFPTSENSLHLLSVTLSSCGSRFVSLCSSFSEVSTNSRMFSFAYSRTCYLVHIRASYSSCVHPWLEASSFERRRKGASKYMTTEKFSDFFDPLPSCHSNKSADFVPFVCFLVTPLRTSYIEAPKDEGTLD